MDEKIRYNEFKNWSANHRFSLIDLFPKINKKEIVQIDLSIENSTVKTESEFNNPHYFSKQLRKIQLKNPTKIIAGGYLEKRALYTSNIYNAKNSSEKRNIHLGLDFWLPAKTPVHAILDGEVICAIPQKSYKGYGGFIILKHKISELEFYTLYGHLSIKSISHFSEGQKINKGDTIGELGKYEENGEWIPHLHFQVMLSLLDYKNDFPGVVLEKEMAFWSQVCPNPNLLFKNKNL